MSLCCYESPLSALCESPSLALCESPSLALFERSPSLALREQSPLLALCERSPSLALQVFIVGAAKMPIVVARHLIKFVSPARTCSPFLTVLQLTWEK